MKRYTSIFLLIAIVFSLMSPVYATPRASIIFTKSSASLAESSGDLIITVHVGASSILDEIGASSVELQQKVNGRWTTVCTFTPSQSSNLMTTGATFSELRRVLVRAGAASVYGVTFCRVVRAI